MNSTVLVAIVILILCVIAMFAIGIFKLPALK